LVAIARTPIVDKDRGLSMEASPMIEPANTIKAMIEERFSKVALDPSAERKFPVGPNSAKRLGYEAAEIDTLPPQATESFAGVGNPLALGELTAGDVVLDLGCGAGMDSILAASRVGPTGRVIGVDLTGPMVAKARANASAVGCGNVEFHRAEANRLPVAGESVDVVISNGVFNLCSDKPGVLAEIYRVLCPGGRLQMADILLDDAVTAETVERQGAWSD
jgi:arsenite methyltransferase